MQKSMRFGLVLSPEEEMAVTRLAEVEGGLSQAALVRLLIRRAAKEQGIWRSHLLQTNLLNEELSQKTDDV